MSDKHQDGDFWMLMGLFWFMTLAAESEEEDRRLHRAEREDAEVEDDNEEWDDEERDDEDEEW